MPSLVSSARACRCRRGSASRRRSFTTSPPPPARRVAETISRAAIPAMPASARCHQREGRGGHSRTRPARPRSRRAHECFRSCWRILRSSPSDRRRPTKTPPRRPLPGRWTAICSSRTRDSSAACSTASRRAFLRARWRIAGFTDAPPSPTRRHRAAHDRQPRVGRDVHRQPDDRGSDRDRRLAAIGVGEGVVADRAEADTFFVDSATLTLRSRVVAHKRSRVGFDAAQGRGRRRRRGRGGGRARVRSTRRRSPASRGSAGRSSACSAVRRTSNGRSTPRGRIHVLQARPITTLVEERQTIFDNANIVESYPGFSLPLTFSSCAQGYERTFRAASRRLGVPESVLRANHAVHSQPRRSHQRVDLLQPAQLVHVVPVRARLRGRAAGMGTGARAARNHSASASGADHAAGARASPVAADSRRRGGSAWHFLRLDRQVEDFRRTFEAVQASSGVSRSRATTPTNWSRASRASAIACWSATRSPSSTTRSCSRSTRCSGG